MIDGNAIDFVDKLSYEDHYVVFRDTKYYVNGCQTKKDSCGKVTSVKLEVYDLTNETTVFSTEKPSVSECISAFENAKIFGGKSFWEAEQEIKWVDY